jgi:two-component system, sensor histidine kinase PdtaS
MAGDDDGAATGVASRTSTNDEQSLFEAAPVLVVVLDSRGAVQRVSRQFEASTGYRLEELRGRDWFELFAPPETDPGASVRDVFRRAASSPVSGSIGRLPTRDGRELAIEWHDSPLFDERSSFSGVLAIGIDVTERLRAERDHGERTERFLAEKNVLLKEIHHRVKDNLQLISSLLYLQAERAADPGARAVLEDSRDRVRSIALIHETLYESADVSRVDFVRYVRRLVGGLSRSYGHLRGRVNVTVASSPVWLDVGTALPCGLILSELATNALRHAFPDNRTGSVRLALETSGEDRYRLSVTDDGVGMPPSASAEPTLGWTLVRKLAQQLDAELVVRVSSGTCVELTFSTH